MARQHQVRPKNQHSRGHKQLSEKDTHWGSPSLSLRMTSPPSRPTPVPTFCSLWEKRHLNWLKNSNSYLLYLFCKKKKNYIHLKTGHLEVQDTQIHRPKTIDSLLIFLTRLYTCCLYFCIRAKDPKSLSTGSKRKRPVKGNQRKKWGLSAKLHSGSRVTLRRREKKGEKCYLETVTRQLIINTENFKNNWHLRGEI